MQVVRIQNATAVVRAQINFPLSDQYLTKAVQTACQYQPDYGNMANMVKAVMRAISHYQINSDYKHDLTRYVVLQCMEVQDEHRLQLAGQLDNMIHVFYDLSRNTNTFVPPKNNVVPSSSPNVIHGNGNLDPLVQQITTRLTFEVDIQIVNRLVVSAQHHDVVITNLPIILKDVMVVIGSVKNNLYNQQKEDLALAVVEVLILATVEDENLRNSLSMALRGMVGTYVALSKGSHIFGAIAPSMFSCICS